MKITVTTKVTNTNELRKEQELDLDLLDEEGFDDFAEEYNNQTWHYSSQCKINWYDNSPVTTAVIGNVKVICKAEYSFSSQWINVKIYDGDKLLADQNFENDYIDYYWKQNTVKGFLYNNMDAIQAALENSTAKAA